MPSPSPDLESKPAVPPWAQSLPQAGLTAMVLVGAWDPSPHAEADATVLQLLGTDRASVVALCEAGQQAGVIGFRRQRWVPLGESGQLWSWLNHREAFRHLAPLLSAQDWDRFATACHAALSGQGSTAMCRGLCFSLALFGNSDGRVSVSPPPSRRAAAIVEQLLAGSLPRWQGGVAFGFVEAGLAARRTRSVMDEGLTHGQRAPIPAMSGGGRRRRTLIREVERLAPPPRTHSGMCERLALRPHTAFRHVRAVCATPAHPFRHVRAACAAPAYSIPACPSGLRDARTQLSEGGEKSRRSAHTGVADPLWAANFFGVPFSHPKGVLDARFCTCLA